MLLKTVTLFCLLGSSSAFFFGASPAWNDLKVTWGINPFTNFNSLPRTEADAINEGFVKLSDCSDSSTAKWRGKRYIKDSDTILILLFDKNGYIAGIQAGITAEPSYQYPTGALVPPFIQDGDKYYITAYFTDPDTICTVGRDQSQYSSQGTGNKLLIQNGNNPDRDVMEVPLEETTLPGTNWVKGGCFKTMGQHYWYDIHTQTDCNSFFPIGAIYNSGKLNAFGFAFMKNVISDRVEHPTPKSYPVFLSPVPTCLLQTDPRIQLSTMHVYFDSTPLFNFC